MLVTPPMPRDDSSTDLRSTAHARGHAGVLGAALMLAGSLLSGFGSEARADGIEVRFEQVDGKPIGGAVAMLRAVDAARVPAATVDAVMDQLERRFVPDVLVVPVGSRVTFPNSDPISHQVYSFSPIRRFQLPLYRGKPYAPVDFPQAGVATLGCNIHDEMRAYIVVTDGQHYGRTGADGVWRASDVRPGAYTLNLWHPRLREPQATVERTVEITTRGELQIVVVRTATALRPAPRAAKPASWDAY